MNKFPHHLTFSDEHKKAMTRAAALLNKDDWAVAIAIGMKLAEYYSEEYIKGNTEILCISPKLADLYRNYPDFFAALSEDGVFEWLMPLVK